MECFSWRTSFSSVSFCLNRPSLQHAMPIASDAGKNGSGASSGIAAQLIKNYSYTKET